MAQKTKTFKMLFQQDCGWGKFVPGVVYTVTEKTPKTAKALDLFLKRDLAVLCDADGLTDDEKKAKAEAEAKAKAKG